MRLIFLLIQVNKVETENKSMSAEWNKIRFLSIGGLNCGNGFFKIAELIFRNVEMAEIFENYKSGNGGNPCLALKTHKETILLPCENGNYARNYDTMLKFS